MANRIIGNTYIIDSQTGITASLQPGSAGWLQHQMKIISVAFWAADSASTFEMVYASNSGLTAIKLGAPDAGSTVDLHFGEGINFEELRCKTLTTGTAWLYLA